MKCKIEKLIARKTEHILQWGLHSDFFFHYFGINMDAIIVVE